MSAEAGASRRRAEEAFLRIAEVDRPEIWIALSAPDSVFAAADDIDARVAAGAVLPLAGTVFAVKDNIDVAGFPTTAACAPFEYSPDRSATAVTRLVAAGALPIGKTNLDQFATGLVGTRSPYGIVRNALDPERASGGSSSGSAVAVALGIVDFALGTDTAGSGRVPAAFNGIVGLKPTLGLVPVEGVVPACRSYDTVTVFASTLAGAQTPLRIMTGPSPTDHRSREWPPDTVLAAPPAPRIALPRAQDIAMLSAEARRAFESAIDRLRSAGAVTGEIDLTPFLECARLLYDGSLVAERYEAFGEFLEAHPASADSSVLAIVGRAKLVTGAGVIADQNRVLQYRLVARNELAGYDALLLPTTTDHPTIAEIAADPLGVNARLGTFSNFVNLLDMCAVSVPAGDADGGPFGVTVVAPEFHDQVAVDIAAMLVDVEEPAAGYASVGLPLVVFGAHMRGLPLNHQLVSLGARFVDEVTTAARYRMYDLDGPIDRPGLIDAGILGVEGATFRGERWLLAPAALGSFLAGVTAPLTLGPIELVDGSYVTGFGCALPSGADISDHDGWRSFVSSVGKIGS